MKKTFFGFLLILPLLAVSQDYQNICSPGITFFEAPDGYLAAFRQDSVFPAGNLDTLYLSYRAIRDSADFTCKDTTNGSLLGMRVFRRHDGYFYFFNLHQDTLKLNTQAGLNESWNFFDLGNGNRLEATVTQIITDSVLGLPDQVKVIVFQAKNSANQNIAHILNGKQIRLSRHYGLSQMYDTYLFPFDNYPYPGDTSLYTLAGKTSQSLGLSDITAADIFTFEPGDEFHYSGYDQYAGGAHRSYWTIKKILGKEIFGNTDSVAYQEEYCQHAIIYTQYGIITQNYYDTITEGFNLSSNPDMGRLPYEFAPEWGVSLVGGNLTEFKRKASEFGGKITQELDFGDIYYPDCWNPPFEGGGYATYSTGLGETHSSYGFWNGTGMETYEVVLVYYKTGNIEWGTPVGTDCSTLVPVEPVQKPAASVVTIIPNPLETSAEVQISGLPDIPGCTFSLWDMQGRKVFSVPVTTPVFIITKNDLHPGLFVYVLSGQEGEVLDRGKVLVR